MAMLELRFVEKPSIPKKKQLGIGTLIFKWSVKDISVGEIIKTIGKKPMYGQQPS